MAVQAQHPAIALPDLPTRASQLANIESRSFLNLIPFGSSFLPEDIQHSVPAALALQSHQGLYHTGPSIPNVTFFHQPVVDIAAGPAGVKKRRRESNARRTSQQKQQRSGLPLVDLNQTHGTSSPAPQSGVVSTGLRLAFDDDRSSVTCSKPDVGFSVHPILCDELSGQLLQQREEVDQLIKSQADQLMQALEERRQRHSKALFTAIDECVAQRLKEREVELEKVKRRNLDLEDTVKQLSAEAHMWQNKAKSNEFMVSILKTNLQQAVVQNRDQGKVEGCGDSEADDAASVHLDGNADAKASFWNGKRDQGELVRACKRCRGKEVSILLLPCLHLCLCNDCEGEVERCPLCNSLKSWSVEVYLS